MLTTKNGKLESRGWRIENSAFEDRFSHRFSIFYLLFSVLVTLTLTGCKPPGPRALLDGQKYLERGEYDRAVESLKTATSLLSTNAQAWNYLGVAYHQAGQPNDAADAYKKALALDQNLIEAHYNFGCLLLEQNHPEQAKAEFTAYTLHRDRTPDGWAKLGDAQLRLRDVTGAEKSFNQARQLDAQNPEALNGLGVIQMQRNRAADATQMFTAALKAKPNYGPAILNLAVVSQGNPNNRQYALQRYQDYLSLTPRPANWDAVNAAAHALEQELNPTPTPVAVAPRPAPPTNTVSQANPPTTPQRPISNTVTRTAPPKLETNIARSQPQPAPQPQPQTQVQSPVEVEQLAPEPVVRAAQDVGSTQSSGAPSNASASNPTIQTSAPPKHGFFSSLNPVNLFKSSPKTNQVTTAPPSRPATTASQSPANTFTPAPTLPPTPTPEPAPPPVTYSRYSYRSPKKPSDGDRGAAEKAFAQGSQAQQAGQLADAAKFYHQAIQSDPGYFDPYYNLGVVSVQSGNLPQALVTYETALAIQPDSHDARFNFALVLKQANYPIDAAIELEKLLVKFPNDANAHYVLGNIYAQQLRQTAKAREHYQKVLDINPAFSQAAAVHNWLWANPK